MRTTHDTLTTGTRQTHWHIELDLVATLPAIEATIRWMRLFLCSSVSCGSALSARPSQAMVIPHGTSWNTYPIWISLKVSNIPTNLPTNLPTIPNISQHTFLENGIDTKPSTKMHQGTVTRSYLGSWHCIAPEILLTCATVLGILGW